MTRVVRAAMFQTHWTGDQESMLDEHESVARQAVANAHVVGPDGATVGEPASDAKAELVVRDLDEIREIRDRWAFHRDRRPEHYSGLVAP